MLGKFSISILSCGLFLAGSAFAADWGTVTVTNTTDIANPRGCEFPRTLTVFSDGSYLTGTCLNQGVNYLHGQLSEVEAAQIAALASAVDPLSREACDSTVNPSPTFLDFKLKNGKEFRVRNERYDAPMGTCYRGDARRIAELTLALTQTSRRIYSSAEN